MSELLPAAKFVTKQADVELNGNLLRTRTITVSEDALTIVFLHDSLGCIELWRDFPERLCCATGCNGLVYDRQGYGQSDPFTLSRGLDYLEEQADVLCALLAKLGLKPVILFGHSDGGSIALLAAAKMPALVCAVIAEGAHVFVEDITIEGICKARELYQTTDLGVRLRKYHGQKTDEVFSAWVNIWLTPEFRTFNIEGFLPRIICPVLAIQGCGDEYGSEKQVDAIVGQVSGVAFKKMIAAAQHSPHKEAPAETLRHLSGFVENVLAGQALVERSTVDG